MQIPNPRSTPFAIPVLGIEKLADYRRILVGTIDRFAPFSFIVIFCVSWFVSYGRRNLQVLY